MLIALYHIPLTQDPRLMEMHFGDWEMKKWEDIDQSSLHKWMNNYNTQRCPGGESYADVLFRVKAFLWELLQKGVGRVLLVTHGGVIRSVATLLTRNEQIGMLVAYGGIYCYELQRILLLQ
jgi:alpha-ribazole phosphatase